PRNSFSMHTSDITEKVKSHYGTDLLSVGHETVWNHLIKSCPLDSPARQANGTDLTTSYAHSTLGFIYNTTAFSNVCNQPSLPYHHGFFDRAATLFISTTLSPVFSVAKISTFNDILFPTVFLYKQSGEVN